MVRIPIDPQFDEIGRRIVAALQVDPRASWSQLSGAVGVSETTVLRRVQRLRDSGSLVIIGVPDPPRCGLGQSILVHFRTHAGQAPTLAHSLAARKDVRYVALLAGRTDVMCELVVLNPRLLNQILTNELPAIDVITSTRSEVVLKRFKTRDQWSYQLLGIDASASTKTEPAAGRVAERPDGLDPVDTKLVALLAVDGRRSYADLAAELGMSETAIGRRVNALVASRKLFFVAMVDPAMLGFEIEAMIRVRVELPELEFIALTLAAQPQVRYVSATSGYSDLVLDVICENTDALYRFMTSQVASIPGVRDVEIDVVLEALKRNYYYPLFSRASLMSLSPDAGDMPPGK